MEFHFKEEPSILRGTKLQAVARYRMSTHFWLVRKWFSMRNFLVVLWTEYYDQSVNKISHRLPLSNYLHISQKWAFFLKGLKLILAGMLYDTIFNQFLNQWSNHLSVMSLGYNFLLRQDNTCGMSSCHCTTEGVFALLNYCIANHCSNEVWYNQDVTNVSFIQEISVWRKSSSVQKQFWPWQLPSRAYKLSGGFPKLCWIYVTNWVNLKMS